MKTKHDTPKYGLLYHASLVGQTNPKYKGKVLLFWKLFFCEVSFWLSCARTSRTVAPKTRVAYTEWRRKSYPVMQCHWLFAVISRGSHPKEYCRLDRRTHLSWTSKRLNYGCEPCQWNLQISCNLDARPKLSSILLFPRKCCAIFEFSDNEQTRSGSFKAVILHYHSAEIFILIDSIHWDIILIQKLRIC